MMKSLKFVLSLALCALCLFSCSEEEDAVSPTGLVGSWKVTEISYEGSSTTEVQGFSSTANFTGTGTDLNLKTQFSEEPQNYTSTGSYNVQLKTEINGQTMESAWPSPPFLINGSWSIEGDKLLVVDSNGNEQEADIITLSNTTLKLGWNFAESMAQQGATVTYDVKGVYVFTKE